MLQKAGIPDERHFGVGLRSCLGCRCSCENLLFVKRQLGHLRWLIGQYWWFVPFCILCKIMPRCKILLWHYCTLYNPKELPNVSSKGTYSQQLTLKWAPRLDMIGLISFAKTHGRPHFCRKGGVMPCSGKVWSSWSSTACPRTDRAVSGRDWLAGWEWQNVRV